jgi:FtsH-binding integral membrane protein
MKKYKSLLDIALLLGLAVVALVAILPDTILMPNTAQMLLIATVLVLVSTFLVFFWREKPNDEREYENQAHASRVAYLVGSGALLIAMAVQSIQHTLDATAPVTLLAMIVTKLVIQNRKDNNN